MKNSYPQNKPLFGRRMTEEQSSETDGARSSLSEDKAKLLLLEKEKEEEEKKRLEEEALREALEKEEAEREERKQAFLREKEEKLAKKAAKKEQKLRVSPNAKDDPFTSSESATNEKNARQTSDVFKASDKEKTSRSFHFGAPIERKEKEEAPDLSFEKSFKEKRRQKKEKVPKIPREKHPFLGKVWRLFFSDTSFRREDCLIPKSSAGFDRLFFLFFMILLCVGSVMVFSSSYAYAEARYGDSTYFVRRQLIFAALGIGVMLIASMLTINFYKMITRLAFGVTILFLLAVLVVGVNLNGAQRWIGIGPITFQPTELAKLTLVMMLAWYYSKYSHKLREDNRFFNKSHLLYNTVFPGAIIAVICGLVMLQKHLSGIIILGSIGVILMFLAGSDGRHLLTLMGFAVVGVSCIAIFTDYTKRRIDIWLDPYAMRLDGGWQTIQGLNAIGSGGLLGLGIGDSRMKYSWVSEPANDFIFTITCEELGFVGALAIIAFFALFVWRGYVIAMRNPDTFARLLCIGIITKVAVQTLLNFAVITNTIPNTGIPLPFFSYGGTSLIIQLLEVGIVLSISRTSQLQKR